MYAPYELMIDLRSVLPANQYPKERDLIHALVTTCSYGNLAHHKVALRRGDRPGKYKLMYEEHDLGGKLIGKYFHLEGPKQRGRPNELKKIYIENYEYDRNGMSGRVKEVTIRDSMDDEFWQVTNEEMTDFFSRYGTIVKAVHYEVQSGIYTGHRTFQIRLKGQTEIPRWCQVVIPSETDPETNKAEGELNIRYRGQPWFCKRCETHHKGGCPIVMRERKERKERREERKKNIRTNMIGTSNMRWIDEDSLTSDVTCIPGARIGHVANQLTVTDSENTDTIIVVAGCNNINGEIMEKEQLDEWEQQTSKELAEMENAVCDLAKEGKEIVIVNMIETPAANSSDTTKAQRDIINEGFDLLKSKINRKMGGKEHVKNMTTPSHDESDYDDKLHLSVKGTAKLVANISTFLENTLTPNGTERTERLRIPGGGMVMDQDRMHRGVTTTYTFGCRHCCSLHHSARMCEELRQQRRTRGISLAEEMELSNKRQRSTGDSPPSKNPRIGSDKQ